MLDSRLYSRHFSSCIQGYIESSTFSVGQPMSVVLTLSVAPKAAKAVKGGAKGAKGEGGQREKREQREANGAKGAKGVKGSKGTEGYSTLPKGF